MSQGDERIVALSRMLRDIVCEAQARRGRWSAATLSGRLELYRRYLDASARGGDEGSECSREPLSFAEFVADEALMARTAAELGDGTMTNGGEDG